MAWVDELRDASFRGVPFKVESSDITAGRRAVQTEFPGRDVPSSEDLGAKAWSDRLTAFLVGAEHLTEAKKLIDALNKPGPGELVHPLFGLKMVQVGEVSISHSTREGGLSRINIALMDAGRRDKPSATPLTKDALVQAGDIARDGLDGDFLDKFKAISELPGGLVSELQGYYTTAMKAVAPYSSALSKSMTGIHQLQNMLDPRALIGHFGVRIDAVMRLARNPLPAGLMSLFGERSSHAGARAGAHPALPALTPAHITDVLQRVAAMTPPHVTVPATPSRILQGQLRQVLCEYMQATVCVAVAQASAEVAWDNRAGALEALSLFSAAFGIVESTASPDVWVRMQDVRRTLAADLLRRGERLPGTSALTVPRGDATLVLAWRLYGDTRLAEELAVCNELMHPGFTPEGIIEVVR